MNAPGTTATPGAVAVETVRGRADTADHLAVVIPWRCGELPLVLEQRIRIHPDAPGLRTRLAVLLDVTDGSEAWAELRFDLHDRSLVHLSRD